MLYQLFIAWRYLFAKKRLNAINIVSGVAAAGVAVATAAMVCVLSVMNGFGELVEDMFSQFDPDLKITCQNSKYFDTADERFCRITELPEIKDISRTIEENALIRFSDKQVSATVKGVEEKFRSLTNIDDILTDGDFQLYDGAFERTVMGRGLANSVGIGAHFITGMRLYAPSRTKRVNMLAPEKSLREESVWISGVFAVNQMKYDDNYMLVSIGLAERLFEYSDTEATAVEVFLKDGASVKSAKKKIRAILPNDYRVLDRFEQQEDFFRILEIEKLLTFLLLTMIILIAALNIVGSLSMLMLDKREDIAVFATLGADDKGIRNIFLFEGWLVSSLGAIGGIILGLVLCYLQIRFSLIKLGDGTNFIISAYPVAVEPTDIIATLIVVLLLGFITAFIPARQAAKSTFH